MKKFLLGILATSFISYSALAENIKLPAPNKLNPTSLMHALNFRQSTKSFDEKEIDDKILSSLLWAAYGINRSTGERTIPTAMNQKELSLYVFKKEGAFLYEANEHSLIQITPDDSREIFQTQDYMKNVPLVLVWTSTNKDYGSMHAGSSYQNVSLFASAHKMGGVVRGYFDKEQVKQALKLNPNEYVLISMAVGYPMFNETDDKEIPDDVPNPDLIITQPEPNTLTNPNSTPEAINTAIQPEPNSTADSPLAPETIGDSTPPIPTVESNEPTVTQEQMAATNPEKETTQSTQP